MRAFKTESKKLLDLMINSIYTNKEIFLRELISNASDAIDKLYFKGLVDTQFALTEADRCITVSFDRNARTITVSDNGIGMTEEELDRNLGTIAHSDSLDFKTAHADTQGEEIDIIGQFGVGFYSGFMVASSMRVVSRSIDSDAAFAWESDGTQGYTITAAERASHGTDVVITLKENTEDENYDAYLSEYRLKSLIRQYSNYVRYPVQMLVTKTREVPAEVAEDAEAEAEAEAEAAASAASAASATEAEPTTPAAPAEPTSPAAPSYESYTEMEIINSMVPIWKRPKSEVTQEEYAEFYKSDFHDFADPLRTLTVHAEGSFSYDALMFIPSRAPFDLYSRDFRKGLALYSSNVLIMDKCEDLLPDYFNFVRGVVDSQDLTLNISRETLQHNSQLRAIAKRVEKKVKSELTSMRDNDRAAYEEFFANFGRGIKYGIYSSYGMKKDDLADLLMFRSAKEGKPVTLREYAEAMPEDQDSIFYAVGENAERLLKMPIVATVVGKGYDVLLCTEDVDEFCISTMYDYSFSDGDDVDSLRAVPFKNVAGADLGLETEEERSAAASLEAEHAELFTAMREAIGQRVVRVGISTRLTEAPAAITSEGPISLEMEKILAGAPGGDDAKSSRVLELNPEHAAFAALTAAHKEGDSEKVALYARVLYGSALIVEGLPVDDPIDYAASVARLMV